MLRGLSVLFATGLLLGCQTASQSHAPSLPIFAERPATVPTILQGGLGLTFGMTEQQVKAFGFEQSDAIEDKGYYRRLVAEESFPFQTVVFTPISGVLSSISGTRYYKKNDPTRACFKEMGIIADAIQEKYPQLVLVERRSFDIQQYMSKQFCEAKSAFLIGRERNETGWQRCVSVSCAINDEFSSLDIHYSDGDISSRVQEERQQHLKASRDQRLNQINVNRDKL